MYVFRQILCWPDRLLTSNAASTLDLLGSPVPQKRTTLPTIGSPTAMSPPSSTLIGSPAVGEFKGWFSNLFHWKVQSYLLYSNDDVTTSRNEVVRLLDALGVAILEDSQWGVLKCRVDDMFEGTSQLQKQMRFRIEFSSITGYVQGGTPRLSQNPMSPPMNSVSAIRSRSHFDKIHGFESVVALILEKGSLTTFKNVFHRVKAEWTLDGLQSPRTSLVSGGATSLDQRVMT